MNKVQCLVLGVIFFIGFSCSQDYPEVGSDFFGEVSFEVVGWDTITMKMSTVFFDSTVANFPERLLVGNVADEDFGNAETHPYFNVYSGARSNLEDFDELEYGYATLVLYYDGYSIGDTTELMEIEVYKLQDEMETDEDGLFYTFNSLEIQTNDEGGTSPIGNASFKPEPLGQDSVEIILDSEFGESIFQLFESDFTNDEFLELLQGMTIKTTSSQSVIGFTVSPTLNIYYNDESEMDVDEKRISFTTSNQSLVFNEISSDRTGTKLENIEDVGVITPDLTDGQLYIQGGLGLALRVDLPYLQQVVQSDDELLLDRVTIDLALGNDMPKDLGSLINGIQVYKVDKNNDILFEYDVSLDWNLEIEFDDENEFVLDISSFVNEQLAVTTEENEDALLIRVSITDTDNRYTSSLDQIIVNDQGVGDNDSKIKLNVIKIK